MYPDYARIELGGVPLVIDSGAPDQSSDPLLGESVVRLGLGSGVKMTHWGKAAGSISLTGLIPLGLDGLDFSGPLLLKLTMPECITGPGLVHELTSTPRDDVAPWAYALVDGDYQRTPCVLAAGFVTVTAVSGAELYTVEWMPMYTVFVPHPPKSYSAGGRRFTGSIEWEEV